MKSLQKEPRDFLQMDVFMHKGVCNIGCEDATFLMGGAFAVRILVNPGTEAAAVAKILRETADFVLEPDGVYDYHDI